jgi:uncharacterized membrane protein
MSTNKTDDAVSEYLGEVEARLGSLPLLQRRELLADLQAHIATERAERRVQSEGEVLEILERLGSPEVVAAAAYEEAGTPSAVPTTVTTFVNRRQRWGRTWIIVAAVVSALVLVLCLGAGIVVHGDTMESRPAPVVQVPAPPLR